MFRAATIVVVGSIAMLRPVPAAGRQLLPELVVRVHDGFGVTGKDMTGARDEARAVLEQAGIEALWRDCEAIARGDSSGASCHRPLESRVVVIRIAAAGPYATPYALGFSSVDLGQGAGTLATVFVDRVSSMADRSQSDKGKLLGRVIAHEVGHLLLGTNTHSASGLMRARWSEEEVRRDRAMDWTLSQVDARRLRQALALRTGRLSPGHAESSRFAHN